MKRKIVAVLLLAFFFQIGVATGFILDEGIKPAVVSAKKDSPDDYPSVWKNEEISKLYDSWGMGNRQCTSWVAWKVWQKYHYSVDGWGDANNWIIAANNVRVTGHWPVENSVAVDSSFSPGHVMWVEEVYDGGTMKVSEYNYIPGEYSERIVNSGDYQFIYFN